ncbi:hypothetical protein GCM10007052_26720 [Halioglobus japonicus]|nr:hypothetical protein GCM10007052_26720 [Halioglobus japonicus]
MLIGNRNIPQVASYTSNQQYAQLPVHSGFLAQSYKVVCNWVPRGYTPIEDDTKDR